MDDLEKFEIRSQNRSFLTNSPVMQELLSPSLNHRSWVNDAKVRRLYLQASSQQWYAPQKVNFGQSIDLDPEIRRVWIRFMSVFYTLEKMGLNVIVNMMPKAVKKLKSEEVPLYLSVQCFDEARHVFVIENYLRKLGAPPQYDWTLHVLGQLASLGFYRMENWLFSTLFSENFASCFLRRAKAANIDPLGAEMCQSLLVDESRHLHFLHIVLPEIMDRFSLFGRLYVKSAQFFIMNFCERMARTLDADGTLVGIDRRALVEEAFENVERAYESYGVTRKFLHFPKVAPLLSH